MQATPGRRARTTGPPSVALGYRSAAGTSDRRSAARRFSQRVARCGAHRLCRLHLDGHHPAEPAAARVERFHPGPDSGATELTGSEPFGGTVRPRCEPEHDVARRVAEVDVAGVRLPGVRLPERRRVPLARRQSLPGTAIPALAAAHRVHRSGYAPRRPTPSHGRYPWRCPGHALLLGGRRSSAACVVGRSVQARLSHKTSRARPPCRIFQGDVRRRRRARLETRRSRRRNGVSRGGGREFLQRPGLTRQPQAVA